MSKDLEQDYVAIITESADISDNVEHKEDSAKKVESGIPSADTSLVLETSLTSISSDTLTASKLDSLVDTSLEQVTSGQDNTAPITLLENNANINAAQTSTLNDSSSNSANLEGLTSSLDDNEIINTDKLIQQCQEWCENEEFQKIIDACLAVKQRTPEIYLELGRAYNALAIPHHPEFLQQALNNLWACSSSFHQDLRWNFRIAFTYYYLDQEWLALHFFQNALKIAPDDQDILSFIESCRTCLIRPVFSCNFAQRVDYMWQNFAQQQQEWLSALHKEDPDFEVCSAIRDVFKHSLSPLPLRFSISVPSSFDKTATSSSPDASCTSSDDSKDSRVLLIFNLQFSTATALVLNFVFSKIPEEVKPYWNFSIGNTFSTPSLYTSSNFILKYQDVSFKLLTKEQIAHFDQEQAAYAAAQVSPLATAQTTVDKSEEKAHTQNESLEYVNLDYASTEHANIENTSAEHTNLDYAENSNKKSGGNNQATSSLDGKTDSDTEVKTASTEDKAVLAKAEHESSNVVDKVLFNEADKVSSNEAEKIKLDGSEAYPEYGQLEIIIYSDLFAELYTSSQADNSTSLDQKLQELAEDLIDMVCQTAGECSILAACSEIHSVRIMPEHAKFTALPSVSYPLSELPQILEQHGIPHRLSSVDFEQNFALQSYTVPSETTTAQTATGVDAIKDAEDEKHEAEPHKIDSLKAEQYKDESHETVSHEVDLNPELPAISYSEADKAYSEISSSHSYSGKRRDIFYGLTMLPHMNHDFYHHDAALVDLMHSCGIAVGFIHYPIISKSVPAATNALIPQQGNLQPYILQPNQDEYSRARHAANLDEVRLDEAKLDKAIQDEVRLSEASLDEAKLDKAKLNEARLDEGRVDPERVKLQESLIKALTADPSIKIIGKAFGVKNDYIDFMCMGSILNLYQLLFAQCRKLGLQHKVEVSPFRQLSSLTVYDPKCVEQQAEWYAQYSRYTQSLASHVSHESHISCVSHESRASHATNTNEGESTDTAVNVAHNLYSELPDFFKPKFNLTPQEFAKVQINFSQLESIKSQDYAELRDLQKAAAAGNAQAQYALGDVFYYGQYDTNPDYDQAFKWYAAAARQGHASAQWRLGVMYEYGFGTKLDYAIALEWYKASALQDFPPAQNSLGEMYYYGQGVEQDYQQAAQWYTAADHQNFAYAQKNLGYMYEVGQGVEQNFQQALYWYKQAAKHGNTDAMYDIGVMYHNGTGVLVDYKEAYKWYSKSAQMNNRHAQNNLGILYFNGLGVPQDYHEACKWFSLSANQHDSTGQKNLGIMYANGYGVDRDLSKAEQMYILSANHGNIEAMNLLADLYFYGRSQTWLRDYSKAAQWYTTAAKRGSAYAQCCLGCMYEYGRGVERNYEQAVYWYQAAAEQGQPDAQKNLAHMFDFGIVVNKDPQAAFKWYKAAAEQDHAEAQLNLGIMYEEGSGTTQDYQEAMKWYEAAAEQGNETAQQYIRSLQHRLDLEAIFDTKVIKQ